MGAPFAGGEVVGPPISDINAKVRVGRDKCGQGESHAGHMACGKRVHRDVMARACLSAKSRRCSSLPAQMHACS